jgi:hypothetical protein
MDAGSFNSMSPLIQDHTAFGWLDLHALIIKRVFAVLCGRWGVSFQEEQVQRASGRPLATMLPSNLLPLVAELLLDRAPDGRPRNGVAVSSHWRLYFRPQFPCISEQPRAPPTSAHKCVQVPAEADVSAQAGIAAASHPILQRYLLR